MKLYTAKEAKALSREDAETAISTAVYAATRLIETLENTGRVSGNGHHARQRLAELARQELASRWT